MYMRMIENRTASAQLATLDELIENTIPHFLAPVPSRETLRDWFDRAQIPRFKSNPGARRGGGLVYYSVSAVEEYLRTLTPQCRLAALSSDTYAGASETQ